jgi:hypothetical protein
VQDFKNIAGQALIATIRFKPARRWYPRRAMSMTWLTPVSRGAKSSNTGAACLDPANRINARLDPPQSRTFQ